MKIRILVDGKYSDFNIKPGKAAATHRSQGDIVDYPEWYGRLLINDGYAEQIKADVVIFEEVTGSDKTLVKQVEETIETNVTSAARELAEAHGIDLETVTGTGAGGRIVTADIKRLIED